MLGQAAQTISSMAAGIAGASYPRERLFFLALNEEIPKTNIRKSDEGV
jgi:hypothetical protein